MKWWWCTWQNTPGRPGWWRRPDSRGGSGGRWPRRPGRRSRPAAAAVRASSARRRPGGSVRWCGRRLRQAVAPADRADLRAAAQRQDLPGGQRRAVAGLPAGGAPAACPASVAGRLTGRRAARLPRCPARQVRPGGGRRPGRVLGGGGPGGILQGGLGEGLVFDQDGDVRGRAVAFGACPPSRAALQAATRPSIRRCAAVRASAWPPGGPNASRRSGRSHSDTASPQVPDSMPVLSRVRPNDRSRRSHRRFSRSSAAPGQPGRPPRPRTAGTGRYPGRAHDPVTPAPREWRRRCRPGRRWCG